MSLPTPTLETARLLLRPFTADDADVLYELHSNAHVLRYWARLSDSWVFGLLRREWRP